MDLKEQVQIETKDFKRHPWEITRFRILCFFLKKISKQKQFILDIGSGDGFIAKQLSQKLPGCKILAVDVNYKEQFVQENIHPNVSFFKNIADVPVTENIDIVLLMDVVEHIEDPEKLLTNMRQLKNISSLTQFIITVPAFQRLFTQHDVFLGHYKRYSRKEIIKLLKHAGFEIKNSGYFFFSLLIVRFFQKLFHKKQQGGLHNWKESQFKTALLTTLLCIDFKISWYLSRLGMHLPGLSCYCICHLSPL